MRVCNDKIKQRHTKIKSILILPYNIHILFSVTILVQQKIEMTVCFIIEHLLLFPAILLDIPEPVVEWAYYHVLRDLFSGRTLFTLLQRCCHFLPHLLKYAVAELLFVTQCHHVFLKRKMAHNNTSIYMYIYVLRHMYDGFGIQKNTFMNKNINN